MLCGLVREYDEDGQETFSGQYVDSVREGAGTLTLPDRGRLQGQWKAGVFEGKDNRYIYPPALDASLRGEWVDGEMKKARFFLGEQPLDLDLLPGVGPGDAAVVVAPSSKRKPSAPVFFALDESTATRISSQPLLSDPFERLCVFVAPSSLGPSAAEGLFARRALPGDCVVTWYSGTRDRAHRSERRRWSENSNTIALIDDVGAKSDIDIDVSAQWATTDKYCASVAHKCNHTFDRAAQNAAYCMALHPRFGLIKAIRTLRAVQAGEELLVDYGYSVPLDAKGNVRGKAGPDWYRKAHAEHKSKTDAAAAAAPPASVAAAAAADVPAAKRRKRA
jgi:histone-lysine N-methyltransferase SETD7